MTGRGRIAALVGVPDGFGDSGNTASGGAPTVAASNPLSVRFEESARDAASSADPSSPPRREFPVTIVASDVAQDAAHSSAPQDTVDELHDELSDIAAWRGESPALTMDELPTEVHLRRIEGRGNMARLHGYTADIHQFPASGRLPHKERAKLDKRVRAWVDAVVARS